MGEKCLFAISDGAFAFTLFCCTHFIVGLTFIIVGAVALADGTCIYPIPTFLVVSGIIMFLAAFFPPLALLNLGPFVWGSFMTFGLYEDFLLRYRLDARTAAGQGRTLVSARFSECDTVPYYTAIIGLALTWSFYCYFFVWMLLDCEIGTRFKEYKYRKRGVVYEHRQDGADATGRVHYRSPVVDSAAVMRPTSDLHHS